MSSEGGQVGVVLHQARVLSETFASIFEAGGFVQDPALKTLLDFERRAAAGNTAIYPDQQQVIYQALTSLQGQSRAGAGAGAGAGVGAGAGAASGGGGGGGSGVFYPGSSRW